MINYIREIDLELDIFWEPVITFIPTNQDARAAKASQSPHLVGAGVILCSLVELVSLFKIRNWSFDALAVRSQAIAER